MPNTRKLIITFVKGSWFVAALQSLVFWRKINRIWTHVQIGFSDTDLDLSAEAKGLIWVSRSETLKKARAYEQYVVPLPDDKLDEFEEFIKKYVGSKYDFFFYVRWFLNTHLLANGVLAIVSLLNGWNWILYLLAFVYTIVNAVMFFLSEKTWACSEFDSFALDKFGFLFLQGKKPSGSDPTHMRENVVFTGWEKYK